MIIDVVVADFDDREIVMIDAVVADGDLVIIDVDVNDVEDKSNSGVKEIWLRDVDGWVIVVNDFDAVISVDKDWVNDVDAWISGVIDVCTEVDKVSIEEVSLDDVDDE